MPWNLLRRWSLWKTTPADRIQPRRRLHRFQPGVESLESRVTPTVFSNPAPIRILDIAQGDPYPSTITVAGLNGLLANLTVTLRNVNYPDADDIDVLLVGPQGQSLILISDAGGGGANNQVTIVFDDKGSVIDPNDAGWADGVTNTTVNRKPINYDPAETFLSPAPDKMHTDPGPGSSGIPFLASTFGGTDPNG